MVVGWYHSHPGFGCWLSGVDINTQQVINLVLIILISRSLQWRTVIECIELPWLTNCHVAQSRIVVFSIPLTLVEALWPSGRVQDL